MPCTILVMLCAILVALLAVQPVCAQEIAAIPIKTPPTTPTQTSLPSELGEGTQIRFVLLDSVSSETASKGQLVRFAVAQDVAVNGTIAIARGTPAEGVVAAVRKGIPNKHDGALELQPRRILLPDGRKLKLMRTGEDCEISIPGCWVLVPVVAAGLAIFGPVELGTGAVHAIKRLHIRKVLTPIHAKIEGTDVTREPCENDIAVTVHQWKIPAPQVPGSNSSIEGNLKTLDACAAHGNG